MFLLTYFYLLHFLVSRNTGFISVQKIVVLKKIIISGCGITGCIISNLLPILWPCLLKLNCHNPLAISLFLELYIYLYLLSSKHNL